MILQNIKKIRRKILRHFEMRPIHKVLRFLKEQDYLMMDRVLEVFGYNGEYHTLDYIRYVKQLDIWEIAEDCEESLKKNLPGANVKITNSYNEIKTTPKVFDTIIIDNNQGIFGDDKCEHFEIIEDCFKKLSNKAVVIANVIPDIVVSKYNTPQEIKDRHIQKRKAFYSHPTGTAISHVDFEIFYKAMATRHGFIAKHTLIVKRNYLVSYLILCLEKKD